MEQEPPDTITSFVNTDWILSLCEQEILKERMIHEGIGGRINMIAQAEMRGFIRAIRKVQELTLLSISEDVATLSCNEILLDEKGDLVLLDGRMKISPGHGETGPGSPREDQEVMVQVVPVTPPPVIPVSRAASPAKYRK